MFIKKYGDLASGIFLVLLTGFYASQIGTIKIINSGSVDAAFIPKLVAAAMFFLSFCLVASSAVKLRGNKKDQPAADAVNMERQHWTPVILTVVLLLLYVVFFERVGFLITTALYLFAQLIILAPERSAKRIIRFAAASAVSAFVLQFVFIHLLYVMLPEGLLR